jgi:hypothetical protein
MFACFLLGKEELLTPIKRANQKRVQTRTKRGSKRYELEKLVRAGVERFMLEDATIFDFLRTIRSAAKRESISRHPLTRSVFSRIVKQAIKKREQDEEDVRHSQKRRKHAKVAHRGYRPRQ